MHHKAIKAQIRKQLKTRYPNWHRLTKNEKKAVAKKVLDEVVANYDFKQEITAPVEELLGIDTQMPTAAIMNLDEMGRFIDSHENSVLFKLNSKKRHPLHIKD
ncbi:MAG: transposase, partial [Desulfobacterales bacterium]